MKNAAASDQGGLKQTQRRFLKKDKRSIIDVWSHVKRQKQELNKKQRKGKREINWKGTKTTKDQKEQVRAVAVIFMCVVFG